MTDKTQNLSRRRLLQTASALCLTPGFLRAQPQQPSFSIGVNVVNVFVTVRDKKGNIVTDLAKDDFVLSEEGRDQTVRYFSRQSDLPLTLGLLVDTTPSETNMLDAEREASSLFFEKVLRPDRDKAFLIQFADEVQLLQDLTSSRAKLEKALNLLEGQDQPHLRRTGDDQDDRPQQNRPRRGGGADSTVLSDAIYLGADDVLKAQTGRKAMIVLGDGDHIGDREQQAVTAAQRADTLVYAIRIYDKGFGEGGGRGLRGLNIPGIGIPGIGMGGGPQGGPGGGGPTHSDGKRHLEEIAAKTGGAYFEVTKRQSLEQIYQKIEEELRSQYSLGYTPDAIGSEGYRRIKVSTKQKGLSVQARDGYYPKSTQS